MMRRDNIKVYCKAAIEEACNRYKIVIEIIKIMPEHVHMIADVPRTMSDSQALQIIKGLSSYLLFRICPNLRKRYLKGHFWTEGYFCEGIGNMDYDFAFSYVENQELHHAL